MLWVNRCRLPIDHTFHNGSSSVNIYDPGFYPKSDRCDCWLFCGNSCSVCFFLLAAVFALLILRPLTQSATASSCSEWQGDCLYSFKWKCMICPAALVPQDVVQMLWSSLTLISWRSVLGPSVCRAVMSGKHEALLCVFHCVAIIAATFSVACWT